MDYPRSNSYDSAIVSQKIMGPNPLKLTEELMQGSQVPAGAKVLDLASGTGLTSAFLAKEYGYRVTAADLWSDPAENQRFLASMGLTPQQVLAVHADALDLPFEPESFDAVTCIDSYNFFGRDEAYLDKCLLPVVKPGGHIYLAITGMVKDCHDDLPAELLLSWTPEQMDYMHDIAWWKKIFSASRGAHVVRIGEMATNEEAWADWLACDNEYAVSDRASMEAGAGKFLNFIAVELQKVPDRRGDASAGL